MKTRLLLILLLALPGFHVFSQSVYGTIVPDSVKKKCDEVIISEIGKTAFNTNVRYIKCDIFQGKGIDKYTVFYSFGFPNVSESHVVFSLDYKPGKGVVKDGAFKNYTRLPASVKTKGVKVVTYADARKAAIASDSVLKKNSSDLYGEISTEYDEKKKDYFFVWYFYYIAPCTNCKDRPYTMQSVYVDAVSGKAISIARPN